MFRLYCRLYQGVFKSASPLLPWREPEIIEGAGSLKQLPELLKSRNLKSLLVVTDKGIASLPFFRVLTSSLLSENIETVIYDKTVPNPTTTNALEGAALYRSNNCEGILAIGGGSPMDCAKAVGVLIARPKKTLSQMKGQLKVLKKIPPLIAVPTTSGTGSEATLAAVITDEETHYKYAINDHALIPRHAVLDPELTVGLPPHLTAATGMDALTHAVEAYIGKSNTKQTRNWSRKAVQLIFEHLLTAYNNGTDIEARTHMQRASYMAGTAFTRAYVGNIHAIAHTLGGFYSVPHGLANAVILPHGLEYYGEAIHKPLAELADCAGLQLEGDHGEKANRFIQAIKEMNRQMDIPDHIPQIKMEDIPLMADRAHKEANPLYPVPRILNRKQLSDIYHIIRQPRES